MTIRNLLNDDYREPTDAEQMAAETAGDNDALDDGIVWQGMGTDDPDGMSDHMEATYDPDDPYGSERY